MKNLIPWLPAFSPFSFIFLFGHEVSIVDSKKGGGEGTNPPTFCVDKCCVFHVLDIGG